MFCKQTHVARWTTWLYMECTSLRVTQVHSWMTNIIKINKNIILWYYVFTKIKYFTALGRPVIKFVLAKTLWQGAKWLLFFPDDHAMWMFIGNENILKVCNFFFKLIFVAKSTCFPIITSKSRRPWLDVCIPGPGFGTQKISGGQNYSIPSGLTIFPGLQLLSCHGGLGDPQWSIWSNAMNLYTSFALDPDRSRDL